MITIKKKEIISLLYRNVISNPNGVRLHLFKRYKNLAYYFRQFNEKSLDAFWEYPSTKIRLILIIVGMNEFIKENSQGYYESTHSQEEYPKNNSELFGSDIIGYTFNYIERMHANDPRKKIALETFINHKEYLINKLLQFRWLCATDERNII